MTDIAEKCVGFFVFMEEKIVNPITNQSVTPTAPATPAPEKKVTGESTHFPAETALTKEDPNSELERLIPQEPYRTSPLFYEIANYFGVEESEYDAAKNDLGEIVDHAIMETRSNKVEDILTYLKSIETKLATSNWDEKRYKHVYRYVRLTAKRTALDKAIKAYERQEVNG